MEVGKSEESEMVDRYCISSDIDNLSFYRINSTHYRDS